jgi:YwiC-like protein
LRLKRYILREYGSWGVAVLSYLAGLSATGGLTPAGITAFVAIVLCINSKQAITGWLRSKGRDSQKSFAVFVSQIVIAMVLMVSIAWHSLTAVLPFLVIPAAYLLLFRLKGEHFILTEITGFFLLAFAAPVAELAASGRIDVRLYIAVAVFFTAGVFKVRVQFTRRGAYRVLMVVYLAFAASIYHLLALPLIALVPLADNMVFAVTLYKAKLRTAGWLEVAKGALFVVLIAATYVGR